MERDLIKTDGQLNLDRFTGVHHKFLNKSLDRSDKTKYQDISISWHQLFFGFDSATTNLKVFRTALGSKTILLLKFLTDDPPIPFLRELIRAYPSADLTLRTISDLGAPEYLFQNITHPTPIQIDKYIEEASNGDVHRLNKFRNEHIARSIQFIELIERSDTHLDIFP